MKSFGNYSAFVPLYNFLRKVDAKNFDWNTWGFLKNAYSNELEQLMKRRLPLTPAELDIIETQLESIDTEIIKRQLPLESILDPKLLIKQLTIPSSSVKVDFKNLIKEVLPYLPTQKSYTMNSVPTDQTLGAVTTPIQNVSPQTRPRPENVLRSVKTFLKRATTYLVKAKDQNNRLSNKQQKRFIRSVVSAGHLVSNSANKDDLLSHVSDEIRQFEEMVALSLPEIVSWRSEFKKSFADYVMNTPIREILKSDTPAQKNVLNVYSPQIFRNRLTNWELEGVRRILHFQGNLEDTDDETEEIWYDAPTELDLPGLVESSTNTDPRALIQYFLEVNPPEPEDIYYDAEEDQDTGTQAGGQDIGTQSGGVDTGNQVSPDTRDVEIQAQPGQTYLPPRVEDVPIGVPPNMPSDTRDVSGSFFIPRSTNNASYLDDSALLANITSNYDSLNRPALAALGAEVTYKRERPVASQNEFRENLYGPRISGAMIRQLNRVADTDLRPLKQNVDIKLTQLRNDLVSFLDSFIDKPVIEGPSSYKTKPKDFYEYDPMEVQIPEDRERIIYETSKTTNEQDDEANPQATSSNILVPEDVDDTFKFVQRGSANYIVKKLRQSGLKALIGPYSNLFTSMYAYMNDSRDDKIQNVKGAIGLLVNALQQYQFQVGPYVFQSLMLSCAVASSAIDSYMYHVTNIAKSKLTLQQYDQLMRQGVPPSIKSYAPY